MASSTGPDVLTAVAVTPSGRLRGRVDDALYSFLGITYGKAPTANGRFRPPESYGPWKGIRDAIEWAPACPQPMPAMGARFPVTVNAIFADQVTPELTSEDCLTLNVWTPSLDIASALPVIVWIHGGGFHLGSPRARVYNGASLAKMGNAVVVSVAHRLGVLGYLYLDAIESRDYLGSSSAGNLDLILALRWIKDNIASFGGDPANVTVFGESGGGWKISCLLAMPAAAGLFQKAILASGAMTDALPESMANQFATGVMRELGLAEREWRELLTAPVESLIAASASVRSRRPQADPLPTPAPAPCVDGRALQRNPEEAIRLGSARGIKLLIGSCADETSIWRMDRDYLAGGASSSPLMRELAPQTIDELVPWAGAAGRQLVEAYMGAAPDASFDEMATQLTSDAMFRIPSIRLAEAQLSAGEEDVYMYRLDWKTSLLPELGAFHGLDIPLFFSNLDASQITAVDPSAPALAMVMASSIIQFARTGEPGHELLEPWLRYDLRDRHTMIFDLNSHLVADPNAPEREAWITK